MDKRFLIILAIIVLTLLGVFIYTKNNDDNKVASQPSNHIKGNINSPVKLVVYGDFECSVCVNFFPIEKQIVNKYINDISFSFKHFPLENAHPDARAASRAAEAAGLQNKFFEMHDALYENYNLWKNGNDSIAVFEKLATNLGLNIEKFKTDFASEAVNSTINADQKQGEKAGVTGTPSYFLNGQLLDNEKIATVEGFSAIIDEAIKNSKSN